jgi:hypothetical protein
MDSPAVQACDATGVKSNYDGEVHTNLIIAV